MEKFGKFTATFSFVPFSAHQATSQARKRIGSSSGNASMTAKKEFLRCVGENHSENIIW